MLNFKKINFSFYIDTQKHILEILVNKIIRLKRLPLCYTKTKYGCLYLNSSYSNIKIAKSAKKEKKKIDHSFERAVYLTSVYTYLYIYLFYYR